MLATHALWELGPPGTLREAKQNINAALDSVAERLGNTRSVCRKYYVHPAILESYTDGGTLPRRPKKKNRADRQTPALRADEVSVLQFLQKRIAGKGSNGK